MKIEITPEQLEALISLQEDARSMIGVGGESDNLWLKWIETLDELLEINNLKQREIINRNMRYFSLNKIDSIDFYCFVSKNRLEFIDWLADIKTKSFIVTYLNNKFVIQDIKNMSRRELKNAKIENFSALMVLMYSCFSVD